MKQFSVAFVVFVLCVIFAHFGKAEDAVAEKSAEEICRLPLLKSRCRASIPQWRYEAAKGECVHYVYGGCGANENSFQTKEACDAKCNGIKAA